MLINTEPSESGPYSTTPTALTRTALIARCAVVIVVALLSTSCATVVRGTAGPVSIEPLDSRRALGDYATVDYCGMVNERAIAKVDGRLGTSVPGFYACYTEIHVPAESATVSVFVGSLRDDAQFEVRAPDEETELARGVRLQTYRAGAQCDKYLVFADEISLEVSVDMLDEGRGGPPRTMCRIAHGVMNGVRTAVFNDDVGRLRFRAESLDGVRPCGLITEGEVADILGAPVPRWESLEGHRCFWESDGYPDPPWLNLEFDIVDLGATDPSEFYPDEVAGRSSLIVELENGTCAVETPHTRFSDDNHHQWEIVGLYTRAADGDSCAAAVALAERAWPRLPEPAF